MTAISEGIQQDRYDALAERVDTLVAEQHRTPVLSVIRAYMNESGIKRARAVLNDAPDVLGNAQESLRVAQEAERTAREAYDAAVLEAEWTLGDQFVVDKNKSYLVLPCPADKTTDIGLCPDCHGTGTLRKQLSADEKRAYIAAAVAKMPDVSSSAMLLRDAERYVAGCRDDVEIAKARMSAAKADLAAAVAELETLRLAIHPRRPDR